jgi:hypothetical protein
VPHSERPEAGPGGLTLHLEEDDDDDSTPFIDQGDGGVRRRTSGTDEDIEVNEDVRAAVIFPDSHTYLRLEASPYRTIAY